MDNMLGERHMFLM